MSVGVTVPAAVAVAQANGRPNGDDPDLLDPPGSWTPVDLTAVLDGTHVPPEPSVGIRNDGVGLFYPGRVHSVASESEAGKTWLALVAVAYELRHGRAALYLDFEDEPSSIVGRLRSLGDLDVEVLRARFAYIHPDQPISQGRGVLDLVGALDGLRPSLCVLDGVTEAMTMHGLELKNNTDIARFSSLLPRKIAARGPAVVLLDHVTKDRENRGRHAIGGQHKLAGIDGAAYLLENQAPFGVGRIGRSKVVLVKDRPGQLRQCTIVEDEKAWFADLVLDSTHDGAVIANLWPSKPKPPTKRRPEAVMAAICDVLENSGDAGMSKNLIEKLVTGQATTIRAGLELLVNEGYVRAEEGDRNSWKHFLVKAFHPGDEHTFDGAEGAPRLSSSDFVSDEVE